MRIGILKCETAGKVPGRILLSELMIRKTRMFMNIASDM